MKVENLTYLVEAEQFLCDRMARYNTGNLAVRMTWFAGTARPVAGLCKYPVTVSFSKRPRTRINPWGAFRIVAQVSSKVRFPQVLRVPIGSKPLPDGKGEGFVYIFDEDVLADQEEAMVWALGHEVWHFLCATKQERGNWQTRANVNGFRWLREFREERKEPDV